MRGIILGMGFGGCSWIEGVYGFGGDYDGIGMGLG